MQSGIVLNQADVRKIIAEYYHVEEKNVIASKYSFIVVQEEEKK